MELWRSIEGRLSHSIKAILFYKFEIVHSYWALFSYAFCFIMNTESVKVSFSRYYPNFQRTDTHATQKVCTNDPRLFCICHRTGNIAINSNCRAHIYKFIIFASVARLKISAVSFLHKLILYTYVRACDKSHNHKVNCLINN